MSGPYCLSNVMLPNFSQGYQRSLKSKYHCTTVILADSSNRKELSTDLSLYAHAVVISEGSVDLTSMSSFSLVSSFQSFHSAGDAIFAYTACLGALMSIALDIRTCEGINRDI